MQTITQVPSSADWRAADFAQGKDWIDYLTSADLAELDAALQHAKSRGLTGTEVTREDFPLPTLAARLERQLETLINGRGFSLIRGFPARNYSKEDAGTIFWGIGTYLGSPWPQNAQGDLIGDVRDTGRSIMDTDVRGYQTRMHLPFHTDGSDLVGLMCLRTAKEGGISSIVSSVACHNALARTRPDLLARLYEEFYIDWREEQPAGELPYYSMPVFTQHDGRLFNRYVRGYIDSAQRFKELPRLTPLELEALDALDALTVSDEFRLDMDLQPGDMQFVNNYVIFHSCTEYIDHDAQDDKRHLKRLWLATDRLESRPETFAGRGYDRGFQKQQATG